MTSGTDPHAHDPVGRLSPLVRVAAGVVALAAWAGLALQLDASIMRTGAVGAALWAMLLYFTIISNLLLALLFTGIALGRARLAAPRLLGGMTLTILLVGVVYHFLLCGQAELDEGVALVGILLH